MDGGVSATVFLCTPLNASDTRQHLTMTHPSYPPPLCLACIFKKSMLSKHLCDTQVMWKLLNGYAVLSVAPEYLGRLVHQRWRCHTRHLEAAAVNVIHGDGGVDRQPSPCI